MKSHLLKTTILAGSALAMAAAAAPADASHFRGGAMVPSVDSTGLLTITSTSFWRPTATSGLNNFGQMTVGGSAASLVSTVTDLSDSRFAKVTEVSTFRLSGAGTYSIVSSGCCRVDGVANAGGTGTSWEMNSAIRWDGSSANTPILFDFSTIQPEVERGTDYDKSLGAATGAGNAGTLSYNQALNINIFSVMPGQSIGAATGIIHIDGSMTGGLPDNPTGNTGADYAFSGNIINSDGSFVEFDWMWDLVDDDPGAGNRAPTVSDHTFTILAGQSVNATVTGTDDDDAIADDVTLSLGSVLGSPALAASFVPGAPGDPTSGAFSWDSSGSALGTYIFNIIGSDGSLTDVGQITVNVISRVAEPATLGLFGLGLAGIGAMARRRRG